MTSLLLNANAAAQVIVLGGMHDEDTAWTQLSQALQLAPSIARSSKARPCPLSQPGYARPLPKSHGRRDESGAS